MASDILIVDDDASLAENVAEILEPLGARVEIARDVATALVKAQEGRFGLVFVDVRLPDGDGTKLVAPIRQYSPLTEVVLMTGDATLDSAVAAVSFGAFAYVLKPFSPPELLETARRALAGVELARERERLQQELERSERRHREMLEAIPAFVMALDCQGHIAFWNRQLEKATGMPREKMLGQPGGALLGPGGVRPLAKAGCGELLVRWQTATVSLSSADQSWSYAVGTDVTGEQEMLRRTLRAERLAAVGTLAAGLAHEVRNPLNSAALQLQVLQRRIARGELLPQNLEPVASLVEDEVRRLERLVNDFLSFAQPRPLELQPTALTDLCHKVLELMTPEAQAAGVTLQAEIGRDLPPLTVDPERLRQVLQNLLRNAIEAMTDGGRATLRVTATTGEPEQVQIEVCDTGPGFKDDAPVFDAFFTTKPKGTGLGLSIVHRIIADHGGSVGVRSRPGDTRFTITLPSRGSA